jgi:hypothetical protein
MQFHTPSGQRSRSEIGQALSESGAVLTTSVAFLIRALSALLPWAVVAWVFAWIGSMLWRRRKRRLAARAS